jgi:hypothetical protein
MRIKIADLRAISNLLFDYLEETERTEFDIDEDYYWSVPKTGRYDPSKEPTDMELGQLTFDWNELTAISRAESPPIGYALVWLSEVLKTVGEKAVY